LLAVVTILGVIAAIIVPRVTTSSTTAKTKVRRRRALLHRQQYLARKGSQRYWRQRQLLPERHSHESRGRNVVLLECHDAPRQLSPNLLWLGKAIRRNRENVRVVHENASSIFAA
jgi:type II secretory pathway pseudopilin PulG